MQELLNLYSECHTKWLNYPPCGNDCPENHYCQRFGCLEGDCNQCLAAIQWYGTIRAYPCKKITYYYVMRFFNRFASEIEYVIREIQFGRTEKINVVSLGCGPGSEVYGIAHGLRFHNLPIRLDYQGYDLNPIWDDVQQMSINHLRNTGYDIRFFNTNMFTSFQPFAEQRVDILVMNYLLSDYVKNSAISTRHVFADEIIDFVIRANVKNVLFNDISLYGHHGQLDTGVQIMEYIMSRLKEIGYTLRGSRFHFPNDSFVPYDNRWRQHDSGNFLFTPMPNNPANGGINCCKSKQVYFTISN